MLGDTDSICSEVGHGDDTQNTLKNESSSSKVPRKLTALCLVGEIENKTQIEKAIVDFLHLDCVSSSNGWEYRDRLDMGFVFQDLRSPDCDYLRGANARLWIYGPTIVLECAHKNKEMVVPRRNRPIYCQSMKDVVLCVSGVRGNKSVSDLVDKVHYMGGSVRKEFTSNLTTHVVSRSCQSEKYRLATSMGVPVLSTDWVESCWQERNKPNMCAIRQQMIDQFKLPPFYELRLSFEGFSDPDLEEFCTLTSKHGGTVVEKGPQSTHLVLDNVSLHKNHLAEISAPHKACHVVLVEWFWVSIQLELCATETLYMIDGPKVPSKRPLVTANSDLPIRPPRRSQMKRISSGDALSTESVLESSDISGMLPEHLFSMEDTELLLSSPSKKATDKRHHTCLELVQTERNYVEILRTINTMFREPLEGHENGLISKGEMALIFSRIKPIYDIHTKLYTQLAGLVYHWSDKRTIGNVFIDAAKDLWECYPPFVNNYDKSKETLILCDETKPRFHAFLKACQSRPECQRQTLAEMLIRPVQRLPSVILLLSDILKRTDKGHPDQALLQEAIEKIKAVLSHINEDKRRTEGHIKVFEIFQDIKNCPIDLISGQRSFLLKLDVIDVNGDFTAKGRQLTLFLFNDTLEITKSRTAGTIKLEGSADSSGFRRPATVAPKSYKHLQHWILPSIRKVHDVKADDGLDGLFCLLLRTQLKDNHHVFLSEDSPAQKRAFLTALCSQVVACVGRADVGVFDYEVGLEPDTEIEREICKAIKHCHTTGRRLTRNISFNKGPAPGTLRRAVSHMAIGFGTLKRMSRSNLRINWQQPISEESVHNVSSSSLRRFSQRLAGSKRTLPRPEGALDSPTVGPSSSRRRAPLASDSEV